MIVWHKLRVMGRASRNSFENDSNLLDRFAGGLFEAAIESEARIRASPMAC